MTGACTACASVGLPPCFENGCPYDGSKPGIGTVDLTRPHRLMRPSMPESARLAAVSQRSQPIGEFLEWLDFNTEYVLATFDDDDRLWAAHPVISHLLARYFQIDLDRVERERRRMLAYLQKKGNA